MPSAVTSCRELEPGVVSDSGELCLAAVLGTLVDRADLVDRSADWLPEPLPRLRRPSPARDSDLVLFLALRLRFLPFRVGLVLGTNTGCPFTTR